MRLMYPRSFFRLLLLGFAFAAIPVFVAMVIAGLRVSHLSSKSQFTLAEATQSTRASYIILEQIRLMERSFRQYQILHDDSLLKPYALAHQKFQHSIQKLKQLSQEAAFLNTIYQLNQLETSLYAKTTSISHDVPPPLTEEFRQLAALGESLLTRNDARIDKAAMQLSQEAKLTEKMLLWFAAGILPATLLIASLIAIVLTRPIRRMDAAIRELGRGEYQREIKIDGPGDMRLLGKRLDWLRLQLDQLEHQKQQFLRHVSHELKTPLTAIREGSALLTDEIGGSLTPQQQKITTIVKDNTEKLQNMIESLLQYTAAQHPSFKLKLGLIHLAQLTETILEDYQFSIQSKGLTLQRTHSSHPLTCIGDSARVRTILDNLISNAVKYSHANGSIKIHIRAEGLFLIVDIMNTGPSIHPADQDSIFEPFYRGQQAKQASVSGSGLGLSIAKEYVEAHGGELRLMPYENGAYFQLKLPIGDIDV